MTYYLAMPAWEVPDDALEAQWKKLLDDADAKGIVVVVEAGSMPVWFSLVGIVIT